MKRQTLFTIGGGAFRKQGQETSLIPYLSEGSLKAHQFSFAFPANVERPGEINEPANDGPALDFYLAEKSCG